MPELFITLAILAALAALSLLFLLSLKGTLTISYDKEFSIRFKVLGIKIPIYPRPQKKRRRKQRMSAREAARIRKRARKKAEKDRLWRQQRRADRSKLKKKFKKKKAEKKSEAKEKAPIGKTVSSVVDILAVITEVTAIVVKRFTHHLKIKIARLRVKIASEDAALTAVAYGSVTQIVNILLPILSEVGNLKLPPEKSFDISADFSTTTPEIEAEIAFSLRVWHLADVGIRGAIGGISKFLKRSDNIEDTLSDALSKSLSHISGDKENKNKNENN